MLNNKDIRAMDRYSAAFEEFTKATNSQAGREMRKERLALEAAHGGVATLKKAAMHLSDAESLSEKIVKDARVKAEEFMAQAGKDDSVVKEHLRRTQVSLEAEKDVLGEERQRLMAETSDLKACDSQAEKLAKELAGRETKLMAGESELEAAKAAVTKRETALDVRERRIREAIA